MFKRLAEGRTILWLTVGLAAATLLIGLMQSGNGTGSAASGEEKRIAEVLSAMDGAGKVEVALFYEPSQGDIFGGSTVQKPTGAVVIASGAEDWAVRLNLIRAVRTLLGLPEEAVDVFLMEDEP